MNYKPLGGRVLVEPLEDEAKTTKSGIVLPDGTEKSKQVRGKVVAVGTGKRNDKGETTPLLVKEGDTVLFRKPWSEDDKLEDKYYLVDEDDVLAIVSG